MSLSVARRFFPVNSVPAGNPPETPKNPGRNPVKNAALGQRGKGGRQPGRPGKSQKFLFSLLLFSTNIVTINPKNKKSGSFRERQLPETCPGEQSTYTTATRPHRKMIIPFFHPVCKRVSCLSTGTNQPSFFHFSWKIRITFAG